MNEPTANCPHCPHPQHRPGVECEGGVDHGPKRWHRCLCLNLVDAEGPCHPLMDCQGGTLGYGDVWHLQRGHTLQSASGPITPDALKPQPAAAPARPAPATGRDMLRERIAEAVDRVFDAWRQGLGETRPQDAVTDAVLAVLPAPDQQAAELVARTVRACAEHLRDRYADTWTADAARSLDLNAARIERGESTTLLRRLAGEAPCRWEHPHPGYRCEHREAQQDPTQDGERSGQPETDLVEHLARGLAGAAAVNRQRTAAPWDDLTADQRDIYRQQARTILSPQTGQPETDEETRTGRCSATVLGRLHGPHRWQPQPGMDPVRCPGYAPPSH